MYAQLSVRLSPIFDMTVYLFIYVFIYLINYFLLDAYNTPPCGGFCKL